MNPKTKEWKDGILAVVMRDMKNNTLPFKEEQKQKWIVLDGDVDPEWIETMNTVMDDNKVLTLVSSERIPLTPSMRLLLEISHLKNATPATVSRGGVLFVNDSDVGWRPYFESWLNKYKNGKSKDEHAYNVFSICLTQYINETFIDENKTKSHIAPVCEMGQVVTLCTIIDYLYNNLSQQKPLHDMMKRYREDNKEDEIKTIFEAFFVFAGMWAYGASLDEDKLTFSNQWKGMSKIKFPDVGQCFDFFYDPLNATWVHWDEKTTAFDKSFEGLFQNMVVPTAETARQRFLLDLHVKSRRGILYVGSAGTGKTTNIKDYFSTLDKDVTLSAAINFNNYTDSKAL
jgi:dynein heavy chain